MKSKTIALTMLVIMGVSFMSGCAEKKKRSMTLEGPEREVEIEMTTTDKDPDDD